MSLHKTANILVLVIGIGLLAASLLADVIGIGDTPFGMQQTNGAIAGLLITAFGLFLTFQADMSFHKTANFIVLVIGIGLLVASLLADAIGIGDDPGFGNQQMMGTIAGVVITAIGLYLTLRAK